MFSEGILRTQSNKAYKFTFREDNYRMFLGLDSEGVDDFLSTEGKDYKCRILTAMYTNAQANCDNTSRQNIILAQMKSMLRNCPGRNLRVDDSLNMTFIFPGTKWCGQGNVAENYYDLGIFNETDSCCRDHDFCDDIIQSGKTKHNLINPYRTTRLHCKCDEALRQCFKKVNSMVSNTVGYIFFSLLQTQCFDLEHPTTGCALWKRGPTRVYCVKYQTDETQPKKWQWFDQEPFF